MSDDTQGEPVILTETGTPPKEMPSAHRRAREAKAEWLEDQIAIHEDAAVEEETP